MVRATVVVWLVAPDVPVPITVTVWGFLELEPQPTVNSTPSTSRPKALAQMPCFHDLGIGLRSRLRTASTIPNTPSTDTSSQHMIPETPYQPEHGTEAPRRGSRDAETLDPNE